MPDAPSRSESPAKQDQGFTVSWRTPAHKDARAPVTSYRVRYRQIGTTSWQNASVTSDNCCSDHHNGPEKPPSLRSAGLSREPSRRQRVDWSHQRHAPGTGHRATTVRPGDANLNLGQIGQGWTTTGNNTLFNSCTGTKSFQIIWNGPDDHSRGADQWAAHINTKGGAGVVSYSFSRSPGQQEYYEMNGTVDHQGAGNTTIHVRGRFGQTWGTWSKVTLYCFQQ